MTESLLAPDPNSQGAEDPVVPLTPEQRATADAAAAIYRGPEAEAAETATPQPEAAAAEEAAGTPVSYEPFALPEGVEVDTAALEQAQSLFAEARLSQPQAQKLVDLYAAKMNELTQRQVAAAESRQMAWVAEVRNDPELGGRRFESARAAARRALDHYGPPGLGRTLDELGVSNSPQLFRFFVRVGETLDEDGPVGPAAGSSRPSAAETLYPNPKDK